MNWEKVLVQERELQQLVEHNQPIPVPNGTVMPNAGVALYTLTGRQYNAIYDAHLGAIRKLNGENPQFSDLRNRDLLLYNDHLLNPHVNTLIVDGFFGTGKTSILCSHLVAGLLKELLGEKEGIPVAYISKPHIAVGSTYGHLPGDLHDKTAEEFKSFTQYFDRFGQPGLADYLMCRNVENQSRFMKQRAAEFYQDIGEPMLHVLVFEYLRGRDIDRGWVVVDETQNTDQKEISTFISRVGDKAKLILLGDSTPTQIDRKGNTPENNGLVFAKEMYMGKKYAGYVEMQTVGHILRGQRVRDLFMKLRGQLQK